MLFKFGKLVTQYLKAISLVPGDQVKDAVDVSVVFGACKSFRVFLYGEDSLPSPSARKRNCITAYAGKAVDEDRLIWLSCI